MTDKIKDKSKTKAPKSKVVEIHKDKKPKVVDVYTLETNTKKIDSLGISLEEDRGISICRVDTNVSAQIFGLRGSVERIERKWSLSTSQPNERPRPVRICEVFFIELLVPTKLSRSEWIIKVHTHNKYLESKKHFDSLGVKYIVDYDIDGILSQVNSDMTPLE